MGWSVWPTARVSRRRRAPWGWSSERHASRMTPRRSTGSVGAPHRQKGVWRSASSIRSSAAVMSIMAGSFRGTYSNRIVSYEHEPGEPPRGRGMSISHQVHQDFERARRKAFWRRLAARLLGRGDALLPFEETRRRLRAQAQHYSGLRQVPIEQIVGSLSRYHDFD